MSNPLVIHISGDDARRMLCGARVRAWWEQPRDLQSARNTVRAINAIPGGAGCIVCPECKAKATPCAR